MDSLYTGLLDYGSLGLFLIFMLWQHLSMQKRFDSLVESFQKQLAGIQDKSEAQEDKLRERYDSVIRQYQEDAVTFREGVAGEVKEAIRRIDRVDSTINGLPFDAVQIQIEALSLAIRNTHVLVEKGTEVLKDMEEEAKLKQMAKKLAKSDNG
jgi:ElaB/YqjD/DUF883 family membrane-anchored ribosome-binding protein